ncbi:MAG: SDR family oxidoreductase [bacterium]|nr:SDR family oxidoreductase [bacterium]
MAVKGPLREPKPPLPAQHQRKPGIEKKLKPRPKYKALSYQAAGKLEGKIALITGGDSGIGRAVAVLYAREGADIAFTYLRVEQVDADETVAAVEAEGRRAFAIEADLRKSSVCDSVVAKTIKKFKKLDILVNNAAFQQHQESLEDITDEQLETTFRTNIFAYFYMARAALRHMKAGSCIINNGSVTGLLGSKELLDYSATKGAVHTFTKSLAQNLMDKHIRVNCVAPGPVWTPLNPSDRSAKDVKKFGANVPMKRPAQPEEMAPTFVFLASEADSSYITGEIVALLGGETTG